MEKRKDGKESKEKKEWAEDERRKSRIKRVGEGPEAALRMRLQKEMEEALAEICRETTEDGEALREFSSPFALRRT